ncbi:MAG: hflX, partial [Solirubrobacteraceae bacterium]|nr:hflX [Solirubrobacteraceae bacterium]
PRLLVLNKVDALDERQRTELANRHREVVMVSALTGEGLDDLADRIDEAFKATMRPMDLLLPYSEGARLAELHEIAGEMERTDTPEGVRVHALVPAGVVHSFERFSTNGHAA